MEPRPWPEDGATEIEKALLRAGRAEGPRKGADQRILAMIQESSQASSQGSSAPTIRPEALARWVKVGLITVVAGGSALVLYQLSRTHAVPPSAMEARSGVSKTVPAVGEASEGRAPGRAVFPPEVSGSLGGAREEAPPTDAGEGSARGRRAIATARTREVPRSGDGSARDHSLGDETKALDRAREALDAHRPSEGLRLLDEYRRRFPQGRLRPEAMILRLAALLAAGRHQAADSLATQLLSDEAYLAYVPRIQSLLREAKQ
jgi:hypothetical protein